MKLRNILSKYPRVAITGAPKTGKTTVTEQVTDRPVIHTDDWKDQPWAEVPELVRAACEQAGGAFLVEGVQVPRTLRKGLEVDAVVYLSQPQATQTKAQLAMGRALTTVLSEWSSTHPNVPILTGLTLDSADVPPEPVKRRYLTFTLDAAGVTQTPQGGRRYPARASKAGVFQYKRGTEVVREYRPADEIKRAVGTLKGAPVVVLHPKENGGEVDVTNARRLTVGHFEDPTWDEAQEAAVGTVVVNDADTLNLIDQWVRDTGGVDISCGYDNERIPQPGVSPDGEEYQYSQVNYVFNHVALGPRGWGRQGVDVGLTLDSNDDEDFPMKTIKTSDSGDVTQEPPKTVDNGATLSPEDIVALKALVQMAPALNELLNTGNTPKPAEPVAPATVDAPVVQAAPVVEEPKKTMDHKDIERIAEAAAQEGAEVRLEAVRLLGNDYSTKGKDTRRVRLDVVRTLDSNFDEKSSDEALKVAYGLTVKALEKQASHRKELAGLRTASFGFSMDSSSEPATQLGYDIYTA